jgi:hypothetical protein
MILTQEQEMIRDSMRAFAQERLAPFRRRMGPQPHLPGRALKELGELGALGMVVPEEWGGAGMDYMSPGADPGRNRRRRWRHLDHRQRAELAGLRHHQQVRQRCPKGRMAEAAGAR